MSAFISDIDYLSIHDSGFVELPSGVEISKLPVFDLDAQLFARLGWEPAIAWLASRGYRLPTTAEMEELHQIGLWIPPFTMPTEEQLKAAGIPMTLPGADGRPIHNPAVDSFRNNNMRSLEWCSEHDAAVVDLLEAAGWDGEMGVANVGKHWVLPAGTIFGWWTNSPPQTKKIQNARNPSAPNFPPHGGTYTDYATNFFAVRDPEADSTPPPSSKPATRPPASAEPGRRVLKSANPWMKGTDVIEAQRASGAETDGIYGPASIRAMMAFQKRHNLTPDGVVGSKTWKVIDGLELDVDIVDIYETEPPPPTQPAPVPAPTSPGLPPIQFRQANRYRPSRHTPVDWVVIHTAEMDEDLKGIDENAEALMNYAATTERDASWHYSVDSDSITQSVKEEDTAWHGGGGGVNTRSIGIEHSGRAMQGITGWGDDYSLKMLRLSALLCADICKRNNIPVCKLGAAQLKAGAKGICGHNDLRLAFGKTTHHDPGPDFPWKLFLSWIEEAM